MARQTNYYSSYTGMGPLEKNSLIRFLSEHERSLDIKDIREAVDYALKDKPSFGGFVLTVQEAEEYMAAAVINKTGMKGYSPSNLVVLLTLHRKIRNKKKVIECLLEKITSYAKGDIAFHMDADNPTLQVFQQFGFKTHCLELRFENQTSPVT